MAISLHTSGSWAYDAAGSVTVTLPTHSTGDMLIARVAVKSIAIATLSMSTATSGWTKLGEFHDGTVNSNIGVGSVAVAVFYKEAASASETNPTIDFSETNSIAGVVALSYQKGASETWVTPVGDGGPDTTADTSKSMTIQSHVSVTAGDMVDFFMGIRDNTTMTVPDITQTGVTFDTVSEQPATAGDTSDGHDGAYDGGYRLATSGTSSAAAVVTGTLTTSETGSAWQTRLRVETGTNAAAENAAGTGTAYAVTSTIETNAALASGTGAANQPAPGVSPNAGNSAGTGTAFAITATIDVNAGLASGTGAANQPSPSVAPNAGLASGTGSAFNATVDTAGGTNAQAGVAAGTGTAYGASISIAANAGNAVGTGTAYNPSVTAGGAIAWGIWSDVYCNPVSVGVGRGARKPRRLRVAAPAAITGTVDAVVGTSVIIEGVVNDDEVVLEILAGIL